MWKRSDRISSLFLRLEVAIAGHSEYFLELALNWQNRRACMTNFPNFPYFSYLELVNPQPTQKEHENEENECEYF
jgi:hypothetical protein